MCQGFVTQDELVEILRMEVEKESTRTEYGRKNHISEVYITQVLNKKQNPGPAILDILGFAKVIRYRSVRR